MAERVPTLLIKQTPRPSLYLSLAAIALVMFGTLGYLLNRDGGAPIDGVKQPGPDSSALVRSATETIARAGDQPAGTKTGGLQVPKGFPLKDAAGSDSDGGSKHGVGLSVKASLPVRPANELPLPLGIATDRTQREVKGIYGDWVSAAIRGDWVKHMSFYADKVEYFSNGLLRRSAIELRKRRIFRSLDSYSLRFSQSPQVNLKNSNGLQEADVIFSRHWELRRGKKRVKGEARGLITLRRDSRGWRIVSERQIKK